MDCEWARTGPKKKAKNVRTWPKRLSLSYSLRKVIFLFSKFEAKGICVTPSLSLCLGYELFCSFFVHPSKWSHAVARFLLFSILIGTVQDHKLCWFLAFDSWGKAFAFVENACTQQYFLLPPVQNYSPLPTLKVNCSKPVGLTSQEKYWKWRESSYESFHVPI